jgi:hypothetical protein
MKSVFFPIALAITMAVASACATTKQANILCGEPVAAGPVIEAVAPEDRQPEMVDLVIKATIKTHPIGFYLLESKSSYHGKPGYPFIVTIDDKTFVWPDDGNREVLPCCDEKGTRLPEGGDGVHYCIEKKLLMKPGIHHVRLELPSEKNYKVTVPVELSAHHEPYVLDFRPVYNPESSRRPGFLYGIVKMEAFLDGNRVPECTNPF